MPRLAQSLACRFVRLIQRHGPHRVRVAGRWFTVTDRVFNPRFFGTSAWMAAHLDVRRGEDVLDVGTGSGIQAIVAAAAARRVVAIDINPDAVACARANAARNGAANLMVLQGDLFAPLGELEDARFDRILFTPPYMEGQPRDAFLDRALYDPGQQLASRFLAEASRFLREGGVVRMLYSSIADHRRVLGLVSDHGWSVEHVARRRALLETYRIWELRPRDS